MALFHVCYWTRISWSMVWSRLWVARFFNLVFVRRFPSPRLEIRFWCRRAYQAVSCHVVPIAPQRTVSGGLFLYVSLHVQSVWATLNQCERSRGAAATVLRQHIIVERDTRKSNQPIVIPLRRTILLLFTLVSAGEMCFLLQTFVSFPPHLQT